MTAVRIVAICHGRFRRLPWRQRRASGRVCGTRRTSRRTAGDRSPNRSPTARLAPPPLALSPGGGPSAGPPVTAAPLPSSPVARPGSGPPAASRSPPPAAAPLSRRLRAPPRPRPPRDGKGSRSPAVTSSSRPPEKPARESEGQKVTGNGCGFPGRAPRSRPAPPAPGALGPYGPAARARGATEAGARPRSSLPTPRAAGASRGRTAGMGGGPGRRRRPPSPWLSHGPPARSPRQGRTALDPPPGRRPTATSRAVLPLPQVPRVEPAAW
jgi:hypothetical protein